jgi:hypothetical protein
VKNWAMREGLCALPEQDEGVRERVNARIGKARARGVLTAGERTVDSLEGRQFTAKSISRSLGRLCSRLPIPKS